MKIIFFLTLSLLSYDISAATPAKVKDLTGMYCADWPVENKCTKITPVTEKLVKPEFNCLANDPDAVASCSANAYSAVCRAKSTKFGCFSSQKSCDAELNCWADNREE